MSIDIKQKCFDSIEELFKKYENNEYMLQRIHSHVVNYLPSVLDNELKNHEKRVNRNMYLTNEQQIFIQVFLNNSAKSKVFVIIIIYTFYLISFNS
jgi:hypothetical protein